MLHKDIYICCMENCGILYVAVILYARMWIEIRNELFGEDKSIVILYARMWIEIRYIITKPRQNKVILYARMWIEIFHTIS